MYTREIKQIIFENFELIEEEWNKIRGGARGKTS
jgi:hypothetical protein